MATGTLALAEQIQAASRDRCAVILGGSNTNDFFADTAGRFRRVVDLVAVVHATEGRAAVVLSTRGAHQHPVDGGAPQPIHLPPADAQPGAAVVHLVRELATVDRPIVLILDYVDLMLPHASTGGQLSADQQLLLEALATFPVDSATGEHRLVVVARSDGLDPRLSQFPGWRAVSCELPDERHRHAFIERLLPRWDGSGVDPIEPGADAAAIARSAGGLTCDEILREALTAAGEQRPLTRRWVQETKVASLRRSGGDSLEVYPAGNGLDAVAGLPQARLFLHNRQLTDLWPRAIVLSGPPGVGKTLVVTAIADVLGWPAIAFGQFRSMWVGETERNLRRGLSLIRAMAPVVVHIDEADQALGQRNTGPSADGGTSERVMASLLNFLGEADPSMRVLFVLTTNRPDALDQATRSRAEVIPILHPTPSEAADLLVLECARRDRPIARAQAAHALATAGTGLVSGRILAKVADAAVAESILSGRDALVDADLLAAFHEQLERVDPIEDERCALKSIQLASFASYLPWVAAERLGQEPEILPYVEPLLAADGRPDPQRLAARIAELDRQAGIHRAAVSA